MYKIHLCIADIVVKMHKTFQSNPRDKHALLFGSAFRKLRFMMLLTGVWLSVAQLWSAQLFRRHTAAAIRDLKHIFLHSYDDL